MQPEKRDSLSVFIGWDPNEMAAYTVAEKTMRAFSSVHLNIHRLALVQLRRAGLYWRPTEYRDGQAWDVISEAPMSTEHAITRFLVPALTDYQGWAVFTDGDILLRDDIGNLRYAVEVGEEQQYALMVVKHPAPTNPLDATKKDGQTQTQYSRKWWSSVMLFNCGHPANRQLTPDLVNRLPGRDLHRFCWLEDDLIGALHPGWNYLVGVTEKRPDPIRLVHFTLGSPNLPGYEDQEFADEWFAAARIRKPGSGASVQPWA